MKKLLFAIFLLSMVFEVYAQNVYLTPNFHFRTIRRGYTGDWVGSQTDTTGNFGFNYNALRSDDMFAKIFNASGTLRQSFLDSIHFDSPELFKADSNSVYTSLYQNSLKANKSITLIRGIGIIASGLGNLTKNDTINVDTILMVTRWDTLSFLHGKDTLHFLHGQDTLSLSNRINALKPTYKEFVGIIWQSSTTDINVTTISNTYNNAPTFSYITTGTYQCFEDTPFALELTEHSIIFVQLAVDPASAAGKIYGNIGFEQGGRWIDITTYNSAGSLANGQIPPMSSIIIRTYP
jgi:hypothetical protein